MDLPSQARQLREASDFLLGRTAKRPSIGVILGSGLAGVAENVADPDEIALGDIPYQPQPTVPGHPGRLVLGAIAGKQIAVLQGRLHSYEGYSMWQVTFPVRLLRALGVDILILTNAAGGLNPHFRAGEMMLITDHINLPGLAGVNPLYGLTEDEFGQRFVAMGGAYDRQLRELANNVARRLDLPMQSGVYVMIGGPSYETPAELAYLRALNGDAVGMSTVGEVIVARQLAMRVLGISCITNQALASHGVVSHDEVLERGRRMGTQVSVLIKSVVAALPGNRA